MVLDDYDYSEDPDFDIQKYCRENETLDPVDIINIRQAFLNMRDSESDPSEMLRVRKLRLFPFLTPDDIASVAFKHEVQIDKEDISQHELRNSYRSGEGVVLLGSVADKQVDGVEVASNISDMEDK